MTRPRISSEKSKVRGTRSLIGAAGEHLVISRLLANGILASLTHFNAHKVDILASSPNSDNPVLIQVKTTSVPDKLEWRVNEEDLNNKNFNFFYCFVDLFSQPQKIFVIPGHVVAKVLTESHKAYMASPSRDGKKKVHNFRKIKNRFLVSVKSAPPGWMEKYLESWDLIKE